MVILGPLRSKKYDKRLLKILSADPVAEYVGVFSVSLFEMYRYSAPLAPTKTPVAEPAIFWMGIPPGRYIRFNSNYGEKNQKSPFSNAS